MNVGMMHQVLTGSLHVGIALKSGGGSGCELAGVEFKCNKVVSPEVVSVVSPEEPVMTF